MTRANIMGKKAGILDVVEAKMKKMRNEMKMI
jgi:hypothetical protein